MAKAKKSNVPNVERHLRKRLNEEVKAHEATANAHEALVGECSRLERALEIAQADIMKASETYDAAQDEIRAANATISKLLVEERRCATSRRLALEARDRRVGRIVRLTISAVLGINEEN